MSWKWEKINPGVVEILANGALCGGSIFRCLYNEQHTYKGELFCVELAHKGRNTYRCLKCIQSEVRPRLDYLKLIAEFSEAIPSPKNIHKYLRYCRKERRWKELRYTIDSTVLSGGIQYESEARLKLNMLALNDSYFNTIERVGYTEELLENKEYLDKIYFGCA